MIGKGVKYAILLVPLYYVVGMMVMNRIDDSLEFLPTRTDGRSLAVQTTIDLLERETQTEAWTPNDPWIIPSALLDNTPNYQLGILYAIRRFTLELTDSIGRGRGTSEADADLETAQGALRVDPELWIYKPRQGEISSFLLPQRPAESYYQEAIEALRSYNARAKAGTANFETRADALIATVDRIAKDLGSTSAKLFDAVERKDGRVAPNTITTRASNDNVARAAEEEALEGEGGAGKVLIDIGEGAGSLYSLLNSPSDDIYYTTKGQLYAYTLLLEALGEDFKDVIEVKQAAGLWNEMIDTLRRASVVEPVYITNGRPDGMVVPPHLAAQGFYVMRARAKMTEIRAVLDQ
ncbi:MAG: hypothetical protein Alpg2KO_13040 [Alphaproteobacteria bacterium]